MGENGERERQSAGQADRARGGGPLGSRGSVLCLFLLKKKKKQKKKKNNKSKRKMKRKRERERERGGELGGRRHNTINNNDDHELERRTFSAYQPFHASQSTRRP